jgi:hypothetical protein
MATITAVATDRAGTITPTSGSACAGGGDGLTNTGKELIAFNNASGSSITVTIHFAAGATVDGAAPASKTVVVAAGAIKIVGPFNTTYYNDTNGLVQFTYSGVTTFTYTAFYPGAV